MTTDDHHDSPTVTPASFLAAATLDTINEALRTAGAPSAKDEHPAPVPPSSEQALAALLLLREVRDRLAGWEPGLIEEAREAGASWADLAHPLGVSSRQAAERRYLRVRPGNPGSTGEQRVQATRDRRAADRTVIAWARANAADLRRLAGQITALGDLPAAARTPLAELASALAADDAAALVAPLTGTRPYLTSDHPELAARVDDMARHTDRLRRHSGDQRRGPHTPPGS
ncbi:type III effector protein [Streptomyces sp. NPDC054884]|uniref:type III effector protein n=1 Tax=Streptomyces sp. ME08-AFT2 TaxID=3028683 RepID=UPI0029BDE6B5|nr:type III effector protein [Streptomyces sp. ME08-AFT2]MDX3310454.1 type III effector protein [Streptomyces sp. ME08-AFT2]